MSDTHTRVHFINIDPDHAGQRLDNFLRSRYKALPKSRLYRLIRKGDVRVNKKRVGPDYRLMAHDQIRIPPMIKTAPVTSSTPTAGLAKLLDERILYEDKQLLVLNKPAGLAVHGGSGISVGLIEALRVLRPQEKYLELVHRLDRETSGCLLIAKKPNILKACHALLREAKMTKRYLLLTKGRWPQYLHRVDQALRKNQLTVNITPEGKASETFFNVRQRFSQVSLLEAQPKTGRTHQIRVHAAYAGHPICGDNKYGDKAFNQFMRAYGCNRLFLHALSLQFTLPGSGQIVNVEAPLDGDLQKCLSRCQ